MTNHRITPYVLLAAVLPSTTLASPQTLAHQGRLLDIVGQPLNATTEVTVALYTEATGGSPTWSETDQVMVSDGYYATVLGDNASLSTLDFGATTYWVGVTVEQGVELSPRTQLHAAPVALARPPGPVNILGEGRCSEPSDIGTLRYVDGSDTVDLCATSGWRAVDLGAPAGNATHTVAGFSGLVGVDMSSDGFSQCAGVNDVRASSETLFSLCEGYSEIIFGCSADSNTTLEYTSPPQDMSGATLLDRSCDDFSQGALNPYSSNIHILSIDSSNPSCGQYSVSYDMYVHIGTQWGCGGSINTHNTGGSVFAWVR